MERSQDDISTLIDPQRFGVSFSIKQCRNFEIDPKATFDWLIKKAGFRRLRLMSYWDEHEKEQGTYDFRALDWQLEKAAQNDCIVSLCLGARQPRYPENHWPDWAWKTNKQERTRALLAYIETVVKRYKHYIVIVSYQLENEALLESFGKNPEVDRQRLLQEFKLIKKLDPKRPIIMTTSTPSGIPVRQPVPDIVGFSYYRIVNSRGSYKQLWQFPRMFRIRALTNKLINKRPSFIHELQLEPWGPAAIWNLTIPEQNKSMSVGDILKNVALAKQTKLYPIDLWGGEWWYWRLRGHHDPTVWLAVKASLQEQ